MRMRRLGWAGVELEHEGSTLIIDNITTGGIFDAFMQEGEDELIGPSQKPLAALVTHLHRDHTDVAALQASLGDWGLVLRPGQIRFASEMQKFSILGTEEEFAKSSLKTEELDVGDSREIGPFTVTAAYAVDGLGSPQVSWVVEAGGATVFHGGDTLWHGSWWDIAAEHGPIGAAFLPANCVELDYPMQQPAVNIPAVLSPEQAVEAAYALQAEVLVPTHFSRKFEHETYYRPIDDARARLEAAAATRDVALAFPQIGEFLPVPTPVAA